MKYPDIIDEMYNAVARLRDKGKNKPPYDCPRYWAYSFLMFLLYYESKGKKVHVETVIKRLCEEYWWKRYVRMNNLAEEEYLIIWDQICEFIAPYIEQLRKYQEEQAA